MRVMGATIGNAFSGMDNAFFNGLKARGTLTGVCHADIPSFWRAMLLVTSFRLPRDAWFYAWHNAMIKTPRAFDLRTKMLEDQLRRRFDTYDVVLQVSGLFAPFRGRFPRPVALICDYTTHLAERNYLPWFGMKPGDAQEWYERETSLYHRAAQIFTASENTRHSIIEDYGVSPDRVRVIGEGVSRVVEHSDKTYNEKTVLIVGVDFERKGGPTLLKAFRYVREQIPEARLMIVGPDIGPDEPGVEWLGRISDSEKLNEIYSKATVFSMPSVCEPFGLVLIEAMAHGLPVLGSTVDAMPEIVREGETGYLVMPGDAVSLANRLVALLSSPELCARMGHAGRECVRRQFLWEQAANRLVEGLEEISLAT